MKPNMAYMKGYSNGYVPPKGNAGAEAKGVYSTSKNPRPVPMKGSAIGDTSEFGYNADRSKVMKLQKAQMANENLRGIGC